MSNLKEEILKQTKVIDYSKDNIYDAIGRPDLKPTKDLMKEFQELSFPLIKWLNDNYNPHCRIIIEPDNAEVVSGEMAISTKQFIKD